MILLDSYCDSGENEVLFVKIGARVLDLWLDTSFGPKLSQISWSKGQDIFWDFIILLDLSYDSGENVVMFVKIGARVPELWLDTSSGLQVAQM